MKLFVQFLRNIFKRADRNLDDEEVCTQCNKKLGYPKSLEIHHPKRLGNYVEGGGQTCTHCASAFMQPPPRHFSEYTEVFH